MRDIIKGEYRTHPIIYLLATMFIYLTLGIHGSLVLFCIISIIYILKYRADKGVMDKEMKKMWLLRTTVNLLLIIVTTILLSFTSF